MSIPGFTGDASVYKTTGHYQTGTASNKRGRLVHPAIAFHAILRAIPIQVGFDPGCYSQCVWANKCGGNASCQQQCINQCTQYGIY
jgi:hypothetical protein